MKNILVRPIELSKEDVILPYPVQGAEDLMVYVKNPVYTTISYYINISGGMVMMGLDEKKVLKYIEVNIMKKSWEVNGTLKLPTKFSFACLEFIDIHERSIQFDFEVSALTNPLRSIVGIFWKENILDPTSYWIALSDKCFALISDQGFNGIIVNLDTISNHDKSLSYM